MLKYCTDSVIVTYFFWLPLTTRIESLCLVVDRSIEIISFLCRLLLDITNPFNSVWLCYLQFIAVSPPDQSKDSWIKCEWHRMCKYLNFRSLLLTLSLCRWLPMVHHRTKMRTQWLIWCQMTANQSLKSLTAMKNKSTCVTCVSWIFGCSHLYLHRVLFLLRWFDTSKSMLLDLSLIRWWFFFAFANNESIGTVSLPKRKFPIFSFRPYIHRKGDVFISS